MMRGRYLVAVILTAVTLIALLTGAVFVRDTSARTHFVASQTYSDGVIQVSVIVTLPQALYEGVSSPSEWEIQVLFPQGPMNVTIDSVELDLYAMTGVSASVLDSLRIVFSPYLTFENTQGITLQQEMLIRPTGFGSRTTMASYLDLEATNSTGAYGLIGGPTGIESVPVMGLLLHPVVWAVMSVVSWVGFRLFLAWKHTIHE